MASGASATVTIAVQISGSANKESITNTAVVTSPIAGDRLSKLLLNVGTHDRYRCGVFSFYREDSDIWIYGSGIKAIRSHMRFSGGRLLWASSLRGVYTLPELDPSPIYKQGLATVV
jgi:hypothetical protein